VVTVFYVRRDTAVNTQFGDVLGQSHGGGLQGVAVADPGSCAP
jgi:hypothetical protein